MYFKSAVIIFALYFVTVAQSVGLNNDQLNVIQRVFREHKIDTNNISKEAIEAIGEVFNVKEKGVTRVRNLEELLIFLAENDKYYDSLRIRSFTPYEVNLYMGLFSDYKGKHDGLMDKNDVINAMDALDLCIDYDGIDKENMNALDFLHIIWPVKRKGRGLDQSQVEDLLTLRGNDRKANGKPIDAEKVTQFFKDLSIVKKNYKVPLYSTRMAPFGLQELLVISAEYSKKRKNGMVYDTWTMRTLVSDFSKFDIDGDGLLIKSEFLEIAGEYALRLAGIEVQSFVENYDTNYDTNGDKKLDIAEFVMALFKENVQVHTKGIFNYTYSNKEPPEELVLSDSSEAEDEDQPLLRKLHIKS